jgi:hypothetical protein
VFLPKAVSTGARRLLALYGALEEADRATLLAFAEFLAQRGGDAAGHDEVSIPEPRLSLRPPQETVVAAIKRLSASYYMLERGHMFHEAATLMTSHVLQGRPASQVIDDLETLFRDHYQRWLGARQS